VDRVSKRLKVSFVIPSRCRVESLVETIQSIRSQKNLNEDEYEIIVVENGQDEKLSDYCKQERLLYYYYPVGNRSLARNIGAHLSSSEMIAFVDSDVVLDGQWFFKMNQFFSCDIQGMQGAIIPSIKNNRKIDYLRRAWSEKNVPGFVLLEKQVLESPMINAASCIYRKDILNQVGGFDSYLTRHEDIDLSKRISFIGGRLVSVPLAISHVSFDGSYFEYVKRSFFHGYYKTLYWKKWGRIEKGTIIKRAKRSLFLCSSLKKLFFSNEREYHLFEFVNYFAIGLGVSLSKIVYFRKKMM